MPNRNDDELLEAWRQGDRRAGDQLLERYFDSVLRFFRSKVTDDVEDLVQQTFLNCVESQERIRHATFRAYLFGIARNRLFDRLRKRHRAAETSLGSQSMVALDTRLSQKVLQAEGRQLLVSAMQHLALDHQIALELTYWEDMSGREVADTLEISEHTVRSRLARAREGLRQELLRLSKDPVVAERCFEAFAISAT